MTKTTPVVKPHSQTRTVPLYKVLYLNDDRTTFEFVIQSLMEFFNKSGEEAWKITHEIHNTGVGLAGIFPLELAELKRDQVVSCARARNYPLQLTIEPA